MVARHIIRPLLPALVAFLAPLAVFLAPCDRATVIVLAASASDAAQAVARADGAILSRFGAFGLIARSEQPGFSARLYSAGAMLVLDGGGRGGCLAQSARS
jgi:hypothetical protein